MIQVVCALLLILMAGTPAFAAASKTPAIARTEHRESGTLVKVAPDGSSIELQELGVWHGPDTRLVTRSIHVAPGAPVSLIEHTRRWDESTATPGWSSTPIAVSGLRPGDFVTITSETGQHGQAEALQVVRPGS